MKTRWLVTFALLACACLENEEELEIHPDGSVDVRLRSRGGVGDLADGHPLPLEAPWSPRNADTQRWLAAITADAHDPQARARDLAAGWPAEPGKEPEAELAVAGRFESVAELPRTYAPEREPYRSAHLSRETSLSIEDGARGRVYVFERAYRGFARARFDPFGHAELPEAIAGKLEARQALTAAEEAEVLAWMRGGMAGAGEALLRESTAGLFTRGELPGERLSAQELGPVLAEVLEGTAALLDAALVSRLLAAARTDGGPAELLAELDRDWRAALRAGLTRSLAQRGVAEEARNAALYALEWQFTAFDAAGDVGDESFALEVRLPGTIVSGNFTRLEDGVARFEFKGQALQEHDVILRATSVLE